MRALSALLLLYFVIGALLPQTAHAQQDGYFAVEGHIFDAKSLRPLGNARIELDLFSTSNVLGEVNRTDIAGLYILQSQATPGVVTARITASCRLGGSDNSVTEIFYIPRADTVYHRDIYLTLPRNVTTTLCGQ